MTDEEISSPIKIWLAHATERLRRSVAQEWIYSLWAIYFNLQREINRKD